MTTHNIKCLNIKANVETTHRSIEYTVPYSLIEKYYFRLERKEETEILTNFYKCGDETLYPHYGVWNPIDLPKPDFHRPEYFRKLMFRK